MPTLEIENSYSNKIVIGIDEAGRGPIAGPVVAACALIENNQYPLGIDDSKKISQKKRQELFIDIKNSIKFGIGIVDEKIIDKINILQATKLAMLKSYDDLLTKYQIRPNIILVDGNFLPFAPKDDIINILPIIKGDQKSISIATASIIAKEVRDNIMKNYHIQYPQYDFAKHMGYPTANHIAAINNHGISPIHRQTFSPCQKFAVN
jgi:ribonuclease HII